MAGGSWQSQNKIRAGAYINFVAVPKPMTTTGTRGTATIPIPLSWGANLTELYSTDLTDGSSLAKVGLDVTDEGALILRKLLTHAYKAFIYRLDVGGEKASATVGTKVYTAKYPGTFGNKITMVVTQNLYKYAGSVNTTFYTDEQLAVGTVVYADELLGSIIGVVSHCTVSGETYTITIGGTQETATVEKTDATTYTVQTLVNGVRKDSQTVASASQLVDNDFVEFDNVTDIQVTAGTTLAGGSDGTVEDSSYIAYFAEMGKHKFDTMGLPYATSASVLEAGKLFITQQNDEYGKRCNLVVKNSLSDSDYVINSVCGYETLTETVSPEMFVAEVTGMDAGAEINESLTYKEVANKEVAVAIINPVADKDIEKALKLGKFILSRRDDGAIVVEKDINSLHTFTAEKNYDYSKGRVRRTICEIGNTCKLKWETSYIGKVDNNANGRNVYKADLVGYFNTLQTNYNAIENFNAETDLAVLAGNEIDAVVVEVGVKPTDAMEKLYMTVKTR